MDASNQHISLNSSSYYPSKMKNILIFAGVSLILLNSCKEVGPAIDLSPITAKDTTYLSTPETPEPRRVLVEEFTGVQCTNCPDAATILEQVQSANPGREILIIGLHGGAQTDPIAGISKDTLKSSLALNLVTSYFAENPPKPAAAIDRVLRSGAYFDISRTLWSNYISDRLAQPTPVNLYVTSSYNPADSEAIVNVKACYTDNVTKKQSLSVFLTEDNIIDAQEYTTYIDTFYHHNHVFRDMLTPINGSSVLDSIATKEKGRVFEKTIIYKLPTNILNVDNLKITAVIHNNEAGGDKEVVQAKQVSLK